MGEFNVNKSDGSLEQTAGMPSEYPASQVMLSDGETRVGDVVEANTLGTVVDVSSYTSSNKYTCPSNGYLALYSSSSNGYIIAKINDMNISAFYAGTRYNAIYVKKGMQIWIGESNGNGYSKFYPLT